MGKLSNEQTPGRVVVHSICVWWHQKQSHLPVPQRHLLYFWWAFCKQSHLVLGMPAKKKSSFLALWCDFRRNQNWTITSAFAARWLHVVQEEKRLWGRSTFQAFCIVHVEQWIFQSVLRMCFKSYDGQNPSNSSLSLHTCISCNI